MHLWLVFWLALRLALLTIVVAYFVLSFIAARRFYGRKRGRSTDVMFWVVVVLALIRVFARFTPLGGWAYQLVVVLPGVAAGVSIPGLLRESGSLKASNGKPTGSDEAGAVGEV